APYGYAPADYPEDSIGRLYDGVPQDYAVPPMYPGLPGQDPFGSQKRSRPWILIASIAGAVVVVLAVVLVVILNRDSAPRQSISAPTTTVSYASPELPTAGGEPTYQTPTLQPPRTPMAPPQMPVPPPAPTGPPKAPGQVAVVGDCIALAAPSDYKAVACTDPKAAWRVIEVVPGGKCRQTYTGFTAGDFSYCIAPQLRIGSCYQTAVVMGSTVFVAADSCQAPKAFMVLFVIPGTKESSQCKGKPGVVHSFAFPDPPMAICTGEFAP
ncbi:MAG: LppU/SCO3897 family protein, partial [[Mycobacterium] stephanolepidis]